MTHPGMFKVRTDGLLSNTLTHIQQQQQLPGTTTVSPCGSASSSTEAQGHDGGGCVGYLPNTTAFLQDFAGKSPQRVIFINY